MKKINVGIIGLGGAARIGHIPWYILNPYTRIKSISDVDSSRINYVREMYHIENSFTDYTKILEDDEIDAVSICTPVHTHKEITIAAAENGKHILVEKPMARDVKECYDMISATEKNDVLLMVGFMKRFNPGFQYIKEILDREEIGSPHYFDVHWSLYDVKHAEGFRYKAYTGGGVFQDHGSHYIDILRWWSKSEIHEVTAEFNIMVDGREVEDHGVVLLRFKNGAIATLETSRVGLEHPIYRLYERGQIYTTGGSISFSSPDWTSFELPEINLFNGKQWKTIKMLKKGREKPDHYMFKREIDHFVNCIVNNVEPAVNGYDGLKAIEVINAAYISSYEKRKVKLPLNRSFEIDEKMFRSMPRFNL